MNMCGFVGFVDFKKDISQNTKILENMNNCLAKRGPDEESHPEAAEGLSKADGALFLRLRPR